MAKITGTLFAPTGGVMANAYIMLVSKKNALNMLNGVRSEYITSATGGYSFDCPTGYYDVYIRSYESPNVYCGYIYIIDSDKEQTLNALILRELPEDINKDLVETVIEYSTKAMNASIKAQEWAESDTEVESGKYSAKYWASKSQIAGVETFNGRDGKVVSAKDDYSVDMITNAASKDDLNNSVTAINSDVNILYSKINDINSSVKLKSDINSPVFTGNPQSVTPASSDLSKSIATTEFVGSLIDSKISSFNDIKKCPYGDLDDIRETSIYYYYGDSGIKNIPDNFSGFIETTVAPGLFRQVVYSVYFGDLNNTTMTSGSLLPLVYVRYTVTDSWGQWVNIPTEATYRKSWSKLSINDPWGTSSNNSRYRKVVNKVELHISCTGSGSSNSVLAQLPSDYCPKVPISTAVRSTNDASQVPSIVIFTDGRIETRSCKTSVDCMIQYPVD